MNKNLQLDWFSHLLFIIYFSQGVTVILVSLYKEKLSLATSVASKRSIIITHLFIKRVRADVYVKLSLWHYYRKKALWDNHHKEEQWYRLDW